MITLCIPEASPSLNEMKGKHWSFHHRLRKHWSMLILIARVQAQIPPSEPLDKLGVKIIREGRRLLDLDNLVGGTKVVTDSLREQRLIIDDSPEHVSLSYEQRKVPKSGYPRTLIEITGGSPLQKRV